MGEGIIRLCVLWFAWHLETTWHLSDEDKRAGMWHGRGSFYPPGTMVFRVHCHVVQPSKSLSICPTVYHAGCRPPKSTLSLLYFQPLCLLLGRKSDTETYSTSILEYDTLVKVTSEARRASDT